MNCSTLLTFTNCHNNFLIVIKPFQLIVEQDHTAGIKIQVSSHCILQTNQLSFFLFSIFNFIFFSLCKLFCRISEDPWLMGDGCFLARTICVWLCLVLRETLPISIRFHAHNKTGQIRAASFGPIEPIMSSLVLISLLAHCDGKTAQTKPFVLSFVALPAPPTVYLLAYCPAGRCMLLFWSIFGLTWMQLHNNDERLFN